MMTTLGWSTSIIVIKLLHPVNYLPIWRACVTYGFHFLVIGFHGLYCSYLLLLTSLTTNSYRKRMYVNRFFCVQNIVIHIVLEEPQL